MRRDKERQICQTYVSRRKENSRKLCVVAGKLNCYEKGCHDAGKTARNSASWQGIGVVMEKDVTTLRKRSKTLRRDKEQQIYQTYMSRRKENSRKLCVVTLKFILKSVRFILKCRNLFKINFKIRISPHLSFSLTVLPKCRLHCSKKHEKDLPFMLVRKGRGDIPDQRRLHSRHYMLMYSMP